MLALLYVCGRQKSSGRLTQSLIFGILHGSSCAGKKAYFFKRQKNRSETKNTLTQRGQDAKVRENGYRDRTGGLPRKYSRRYDDHLHPEGRPTPHQANVRRGRCSTQPKRQAPRGHTCPRWKSRRRQHSDGTLDLEPRGRRTLQLRRKEYQSRWRRPDHVHTDHDTEETPTRAQGPKEIQIAKARMTWQE